MKISRGFKNNYGGSFDNIVNIDFESIDEMNCSLGSFVTETKKDNISVVTDKNELLGVYLHRMKEEQDSDYAFRIYRNYDKAMIHRCYDDVLVSKLQKKQKYVKKTDFPIGVVSIKNYVIGQIIVYYDKCETLFNYLRYCEDVEVFKSCCFQIIDIIEELLRNDIYFTDIHSKNFMVDSNGKIKIIDFENSYVKFCDNDLYNKILDRLIYMFKYVSKCIDFFIPYDSSLDELKEKILSM